MKFNLKDKLTVEIKQKLLNELTAKYFLPFDGIDVNPIKNETHKGFFDIRISNYSVGELYCEYAGGFNYNISDSKIDYAKVRPRLQSTLEELIVRQFSIQILDGTVSLNTNGVPFYSWGLKIDVFVKKSIDTQDAFTKLDFQYKNGSWEVIQTDISNKL
ncbi:MAG: hypothetical protein WCK02_07590 [Bacteroidota bacterium]